MHSAGLAEFIRNNDFFVLTANLKICVLSLLLFLFVFKTFDVLDNFFMVEGDCY